MEEPPPFVPANVPDISNPQQLAECLLQLMIPDNDARIGGELMLRKFCLHPRCLPGFFQHISTHPAAEVRHMAAILMRVKLKTLFMSLDMPARANIMNGLLDRAMKEESHVVRCAIAHCIGAIAIQLVPQNAWADLQSFMVNLVRSPQGEHREIGVLLFNSLLEGVPMHMVSSVPSVVNVFQLTLRDKFPRVLGRTLTALEHLLKVCVRGLPNVSPFVPLIRPLAEVTSQAIQSDAPFLMQCFTILDDLACVRSDVVDFNNSMSHLARMMCDVAGHPGVQPPIRRRAGEFVGWTVKFNTASIVRSQGLVDQILNVAFKLIVCPEDPDDDEDTPTLYKEGTSLLDELCCSLPSLLVFEKVVSTSLQMVNRGPNIHVRKGGLTALGVMAEGCYEKTRENLDKLIPMMIQAYGGSGDVSVRKVATMAVVNYCEYCQPEVNEFAAQVIPFIVNGLDDPHLPIRSKFCLLIDTYGPRVNERELRNHAGPLLTKLFNMLKIRELTDFLRTNVISSISTIAEASGNNFMPFFQTTMDAMNFILTNAGPGGRERIVMRGRALECIGVVARSVGADTFGPLVEPLMIQAFNEVRAQDSADLREYALNFIQNIAHCLGPAFQKYLETTLNLVFAVLDTPDGVAVQRGEPGEFLEAPKPPTVARHLSELDLEKFNVEIRTSVIDEKCAAYSCLGQLAISVGRAYMPYFQATMDRLRNNINYFSAPMRRKVVLAMHRVVTAVCPTPISPMMPPDALRFAKVNFNELCQTYVARLTEDDDKECVARICDAIYFLCRDFGFVAVEDTYALLANAFIELLTKNGQCFIYDSVVLDDANADHDNLLLDSLLNGIDWLGKTVGPPFEPHYRAIFPILMKYQKHRAHEDRMGMVGCLAEMTVGLGQQIVPYAREFLGPVLDMANNDPSMPVRRNAIFCLGLVAYHAPQLVASRIQEFVSLFGNVLDHPDQFSRTVVDNSAGAMARLILAQHQIPLDQAFTAMVRVMPLQEDLEECGPCYQCIMQMVKQQHAAVGANLPQVLLSLGWALGHNDVNPELQNEIVQAIRFLKTNQQASVQQALSNLNPQMAQKIAQV